VQGLGAPAKPDAIKPVAHPADTASGPAKSVHSEGAETLQETPEATFDRQSLALESFRTQWSKPRDAGLVSETPTTPAAAPPESAVETPLGEDPAEPAAEGPVTEAATDEQTVETRTDEPSEADAPLSEALAPAAHLGSRQDVEPPTTAEGDIPEGDRLTISLGDMIASGDPSVRLRNVARNAKLFQAFSLADYIDGEVREAQLLTLPNFGRTSLRDLNRLVRDYRAQTGAYAPQDEPPLPPAVVALSGMTVLSLRNHQRLPVRIANRLADTPALSSFPLSDILSDPQGSRRRLRTTGGIGTKSVDDLFALVARVATEMPVDLEPGESAPASQPGQEVVTTALSVDDAMAALSEKHRYVLNARYGLDGAEPLTLEQVARRVFVTRERVRQVQKAAVKNLSRHPWISTFETLLERDAPEAWAALAEGRDFLPSGDVSGRDLPIAPETALAIDVVHGDIRKWLAAFAVPSTGGWLAPGSSAEDRQRIVRRVRETIDGHILPFPATDLAAAAGLTDRDFIQALGAVPTVRLHEGYVHTGFFGSKTRRIARLHRLAVEEGRAVVDVWRLHALDVASDHTDERSARMVLIQLNENPHLFTPLFDHLWLVLDPSVSWSETKDVLECPSLESLDPGFEEGSLSRWLWNRLSEAGPMRQSDLRDEALAVFPNVKSSSVGPIMQMHPVFLRLAPGVFDVRRPRSGGVSSALLTDFQGRAYARARRSGATSRYFSGWTDDFEWKLCEWARQSGDPAVYRSILEISEPSAWPAPAAVRSEWQEQKIRHGRWSLSTERRTALGGSPPDGQEFLACLAHLVAFGSIGWISADRIMQNRLGSKGAADLLALVVACGAAVPPDDWQAPHQATPTAADLLATLSKALRTGGRLEWTAAPLNDLLTRAATQTGAVTWAQPGEVHGLLEALAHPTSPPKTTAAHALAEADALFESDEWDDLFQD
jgi:hypothetical protein